MKAPMTPPIANMGRKAAMVVRVETTTGQNTSFAPASAATRGAAPFSM